MNSPGVGVSKSLKARHRPHFVSIWQRASLPRPVWLCVLHADLLDYASAWIKSLQLKMLTVCL